MITILITLVGLLLISFIIWWFWLSQSRPSSIQINNTVKIKVKNGVYEPASIQIPLNKPITLRFIREDPSPCAELVIFTTLNINKPLSLNQATDIQLILSEPGEYEFTCQMGMYRGKLITT